MNLTEQMRQCRKCPELSEKRRHVVIGEGVVPAPCVFLGEGPGEKEDETGRPFIGRAGTLLRTVIAQSGFKPGEYHILNCIKCRPPDNRNPTEEELANCRPFLVKQLAALKPKVIVALGRFAQAFVLGEKEPNKLQVVDNSGKIVFYKGDVHALLTMHPSYVSRHTSDEIYFAFLRHISRARRLARGAK
jgi:DNA polymerase